MIYDVFHQPYQAMVMVYYGVLAGLAYELLRPLRLGGSLGRVMVVDGVTLLTTQICLLWGLMTAANGEVRLYALLLFFLSMGLVRWAIRPLFTEILQKICKNRFPFG